MRRRSPAAAIPAVSVVVPYFDAAGTLLETVESVLAQTFEDWELLLIDDGSADAGSRLAAGLAAKDPERVRCLKHPRGARRGAFASRLLGARRASAPLIALLDADDLWDEDYLQRHLERWKKVRRRGAALSYGPARYWFPHEPSGALDFVHAMPALEPKVFRPGELLQNFLSSGYATVPRTSCSLILRDAVLEVAPLAAAARKSPYFEDQFLMWGIAMRRPVAAHLGAWVRYRQKGPLKERPAEYVKGTLRDERAFLPVMERELKRLLPGHPLLGPGGLAARRASLRRPGRASVFGDYFFERIPAELRRLDPSLS